MCLELLLDYAFNKKIWKQTGEKNENYTLVVYYAAINGNLLPMFWGTVLGPSSGVKNPKEKMSLAKSTESSKERRTVVKKAL